MPTNQQTDIALIKQDISYIKDEVKGITTTLRDGYVTHGEFDSLRDKVNLLYRGVLALLFLFASAIVAALFKGILK